MRGAGFALFAAAASAAAIGPPSQLRVTFSPRAAELVAGWTTLGIAPSSTVESGPAPDKLSTRTVGSITTFANDKCPTNSTRTSHSAAFPAPPGVDTFYRVSSDGGATWSNVTRARNPARAYPARVALWGDLGVECGGVLPPSPGFAGGQCTAVPQLALDGARESHGYTIHFGDTAVSLTRTTPAHQKPRPEKPNPYPHPTPPKP
jgi:hypothetical protein